MKKIIKISGVLLKCLKYSSCMNNQQQEDDSKNVMYKEINMLKGEKVQLDNENLKLTLNNTALNIQNTILNQQINQHNEAATNNLMGARRILQEMADGLKKIKSKNSSENKTLDNVLSNIKEVQKKYNFDK